MLPATIDEWEDWRFLGALADEIRHGGIEEQDRERIANRLEQIANGAVLMVDELERLIDEE